MGLTNESAINSRRKTRSILDMECFNILETEINRKLSCILREVGFTTKKLIDSIID